MEEKTRLMEELLNKASLELKELKFDFYARNSTENVGLYVAYNPDKKQFVIVICEKDNPEVAISVPVFLVNAEGKCRDVFDREFKEFQVYEDHQGGVQFKIIDSSEPKNVLKMGTHGEPQNIDGVYPRYYLSFRFTISSDLEALRSGEGGLIDTNTTTVMAWDRDSLKRYVAKMLDEVIAFDDAENAKEPEDRYTL